MNLNDRFGKTALHNACENGKTDIVNLLLDSARHGIDTCPVVTYTSRNETILHLACRHKNLQTVKVLYERSKEIGLDLNKRNHDGFNAFLIACSYGQFDIVKFMVEHPEDFELNALSTTDENALHLSCEYDNENYNEVLKLLLLDHPEIGLDVNQKDDYGKTPLYNACVLYQNEEMVKFLFANAKKIGLDVLITYETMYDHAQTILHVTVQRWDITFEMVKVIVSYANDLNLDIITKTNSDGKTALDMAQEHLSTALSCYPPAYDYKEEEKWKKIVAFLSESTQT